MFISQVAFRALQVGISLEQEMRIVLDSDEERFGGHCRLEEGHGKLPRGGPTHNRRGAGWFGELRPFWACPLPLLDDLHALRLRWLQKVLCMVCKYAGSG